MNRKRHEVQGHLMMPGAAELSETLKDEIGWNWKGSDKLKLPPCCEGHQSIAPHVDPW